MRELVAPVEVPVIVGIDDSELSFAALRNATRQIAAQHRRMRLVHAFNWVGTPGVDKDVAWSAADLNGLMERAVKAVREVAPEIDVETELVQGSALVALTRNAEYATAVVLGGRRNDIADVIPWESLTVQVASRAACPVLVVRPEPPPVDAPLLVGVDGSHMSELALAWAVEVASYQHASIVAAQVRDQEWEQDRREGIRLDELRVVVERVQADYPDVPIEQRILTGEPGPELLAAAEEAQLVLVGPRGSQPTRGMLGEVSQTVLYHSRAPVLIVRGRRVSAVGSRHQNETTRTRS